MEALFDHVGGCGRFQMLFVVLSHLVIPATVWSMMHMVFGGLEPDWTCGSRGQAVDNSSYSNANDYEATTATVGNAGHHSYENYSRQHLWNVTGMTNPQGISNTSHVCENVGVECKQVIFAPGINTVVSEFQLVCQLSWVPMMIISVQMCGVLVGAAVSGQLGDSIGRKKCLLSMSILQVTFNLVAAFSISWEMFTVLRFMIGFTVGGLLASSFTYPTEFVDIRHRAALGAIPVWGIGSITFSLVVWLLRDWRHLHIATALFTATSLPGWWFLPESVRWLKTKGQVRQAERVLQQIARWNRRSMPGKELLNSLDFSKEQAKKTCTYLHIFKPHLAKATILGGFMWFACSLTYYGISFGIKSLSGNFYLNLLLMSVVELPQYLFIFHVVNWLGRRWACFLSFLIATLSILTVIPISLLLSPEESGSYINALSMMAKMFLGFGWTALGIFVVELYPTVVRNISQGYCNTTARIGGILAPYILSGDKTYVFYVVIGVAMIITTIAPLMLNETQGRPLADTFEVRIQATATQHQGLRPLVKGPALTRDSSVSTGCHDSSVSTGCHDSSLNTSHVV